MEDSNKITWVWDFLSKYWKILFDTQMEIPDVESDISDDDSDQTNDYDN